MARIQDLYPLLIGGKRSPGASGVDLDLVIAGDTTPPENNDPDAVSVLLFSLEDRRFAVAVENTEGVVECPKITPLPSGPDGIIGITSVRGRMTLVVDASLNEAKQAGKRRLILLRGEAQLGLIADQVHDVVTLDRSDVKPMPERRVSRRLLGGTAGGKQNIVLAKEYVRAGGRRVPIMDLELLSRL
ncbi:MAG: chemotaxis protein CheW [Blastocatellia bacterium]